MECAIQRGRVVLNGIFPSFTEGKHSSHCMSENIRYLLYILYNESPNKTRSFAIIKKIFATVQNIYATSWLLVFFSCASAIKLTYQSFFGSKKASYFCFLEQCWQKRIPSAKRLLMSTQLYFKIVAFYVGEGLTLLVCWCIFVRVAPQSSIIICSRLSLSVAPDLQLFLVYSSVTCLFRFTTLHLAPFLCVRLQFYT